MSDKFSAKGGSRPKADQPLAGAKISGGQFPKNFLWGAATSAHQVEGGNRNDWSEWEKQNAGRLAAEAEKNFGHLASWPMIWEEAKRPENYISGIACDHYSRFREDFDIAKSLGHNAHRFSIEWSRIEPEEGKFNEQEVEHYREVIRALRERGMEPFVTLWHWTNPVWFGQRGGWLRPDAPEIFARFCGKIVESFPEVKFWITLNEPEAFARHGYFSKDRPPAQGGIAAMFLVLRNLAKGHKASYRTIKNLAPEVSVGYSESCVYFEPYDHWPHNILAMYLLRWWRNNPFFGRMSAESDFIGLQFYFHTRVRIHPKSQWWFQYNENKKVTDMGWEIYPEGIYHVLSDLKKYNKPIYITENGLADACDQYRGDFIKEHLWSVAKAMSNGVDVRGYFYWSLLDNFEWHSGFWPRFGLIEIDYKTLERRVRKSALVYKRIIESACLPAEASAKEGEYKKIIQEGL